MIDEKVIKSLKIIYNSCAYGTTCKIQDEKDLEVLISIAEKNQLLNVLYYALEKPHNEYEKIKHTYVFQKIKSIKQTLTFENIIREFHRNKIKVTVIKGYVYREFYIYNDMRVMGDIDFIVDEDKYDIAKKILLKTLNFKKIDEDYLELVAVSSDGIVVELHHQLTSKTSSNCNFFNHEYHNNLIKIKDYYTMNHNFHFLYMLDHIHKHYINGGLGIKYLMDFAIYLNKFPNILIENQKQIIELNLVYICVAFIMICENYLNIIIKHNFNNYYSLISDDSVDSLLNLMVLHGEYGTISSRINAKEAHGIYVKRIFMRVFPSIKRIYSKDHNKLISIMGYPFVLPWYWIKTALRNKTVLKEMVTKNNKEDISRIKKMYNEIK